MSLEKEGEIMDTILIIVVLILLFGGGGYYWRGRRG
jgi:LPXTG-motif cell wall-anchored protein